MLFKFSMSQKLTYMTFWFFIFKNYIKNNFVEENMHILIGQFILWGFNNYCKVNTHSQSETKYDQLIKFTTLK